MNELDELIIRNIEATKKRGQIHSHTKPIDHLNKLKEEIKELEDSMDENGNYDPLEAIDVFLVSGTMLVCEQLYPYLIKKVEINEQRASDIMTLNEAIKVMEAHEKWRQGGVGIQTVPTLLTRATETLLSFARAQKNDAK